MGDKKQFSIPKEGCKGGREVRKGGTEVGKGMVFSKYRPS